MSIPLQSTRPVIEVTADDPRAWGYVTPGEHSYYRSFVPADADRDAARFVRTEIAPLGWVHLQRVVPETMPSMVLSHFDFTFADTTPADAVWRLAYLEAEAAAWLQMVSATADLQQTVAASTLVYHWEPGLAIRFRLADPPSGQVRPAFVGFGVGPVSAGSWFSLRIPREVRRDDTSSTQEHYSAPSVVVFDGSTPQTIATYEGGFNLTANATHALLMRLVGNRLIVQGAEWGEPWMVELPPGAYSDTASLRIGVTGGPGIFHVCQMEYATDPADGSRRGYVQELTAPPHPVHCASGTPDTIAVNYAIGGLTSVSTAASPLKATLVGSQYRSPFIRAISPYWAADLATPVTDEQSVTRVTRAEVHLNYDGRGQTCGLWFDRRADLSDMPIGSIVTVAAAYAGDETVTLFKGRVTDPLRWRTQDLKLQPPQLVLADEFDRLQRKFCWALRGRFQGFGIGAAATVLLRAAGIDTTARLTVSEPSAVLQSDDPDGLVFARDTSIARALDICAASAGQEWYQDHLGAFVVQSKPTYGGSADHTLDTASTTYTAAPLTISREYSLGGGYANHVYVEDVNSGAGAVYADADAVIDNASPRFVGDDLWEVRLGEFGDPAVAAEEAWKGASQARDLIEFSRRMDFSALVKPRQTVSITTAIANMGIDAGSVWRIQETIWVIDAPTDGRLATATVSAVALLEVPAE